MGLATLVVLGAALGTQPALAAQPSVAPSAIATVHQLRRCVHSIPAADRLLLTLRFGIGGLPQRTDAAVAARLHTTAAAVAQREALAVGRLVDARRRGVCTGGPVTASAASSNPVPALSPVSAAGDARAPGGGGISSNALLAGAVILAALVIAGREFRKAIFGPPPRH